jgi:hypothetical protein
MKEDDKDVVATWQKARMPFPKLKNEYIKLHEYHHIVQNVKTIPPVWISRPLYDVRFLKIAVSCTCISIDQRVRSHSGLLMICDIISPRNYVT